MNTTLPEVKLPETERGARVGVLNGAVDHLDLALLDGARQAGLPADHKEAGRPVDAERFHAHDFKDCVDR